MDIRHLAVLCFLATLFSQSSQHTPTKCLFGPVTGMCKAYIPRYFFNTTSEACEEFIYGGCQGNENNFATKEECEKECIIPEGANHCLLEPDTGLCRAMIPRYFYNGTSATCEIFTYGGCGGNDNKFETKEECLEKCTPQVRQYLQIPHEQSQYHCFLKPQVGGCKGMFPRYFYNTTLRGCQMFFYGGCDGNANNFEELDTCTDSCEGAEHCLLKPDEGNCHALIPRQFYNYTSNKCELFFYGGCAGNTNNFNDEESCMEECGFLKDGNYATSMKSSAVFMLLLCVISVALQTVL